MSSTTPVQLTILYLIIMIGYSIVKMASRLLPTCRNAVSLRRLYSQLPHHKRTPHYGDFKKGITVLRSQLVEEHKLNEKMTNEDFNSQAAQDVRLEREREEKALEQNEKEIQRMAERRCF